MNALNILPRPVLVSLAAVLIAVLVTTGYVALKAGDASAQSNLPNKATGLKTEGTQGKNAIGNNEARIVWTKPADGNCAVTEYYLRFYLDEADSGFTTGQGLELTYTTQTAYVATHLRPGKWHRVEVWTYGASCDNYSAEPVKLRFRTNASNNSNDPVAAANQPKPAPNSPGTVTMTKSGTSATVNWSAPAADASRCSLTDYSYRLNNHTTHNVADDVDGIATSTTASFTGLTVGHKYYFEVWSYSTHPCDVHSSVSDLFWSQ